MLQTEMQQCYVSQKLMQCSSECFLDTFRYLPAFAAPAGPVSAAKQSPIRRSNSRLSNVSKQGETSRPDALHGRSLRLHVLTLPSVFIHVCEQALETSPSQCGKAAQPQSPLCRAVLTTQSQPQQRAHQAYSNRLHQLQQMPALTAGRTSHQQVAQSQAGLLHSALSCSPAQESRRQQQQERLSRQWAAWEAGRLEAQAAASIRLQVNMARTAAACFQCNRSPCALAASFITCIVQQFVSAHDAILCRRVDACWPY